MSSSEPSPGAAGHDVGHHRPEPVDRDRLDDETECQHEGEERDVNRLHDLADARPAPGKCRHRKNQRTAERRKGRAHVEGGGDEEPEQREREHGCRKHRNRERPHISGLAVADEVTREEATQHQPFDSDGCKPGECHRGPETRK